VRFGIALGRTAHDSVVARNRITDFMSDGLRGLADDCVFEGNVVENCYAIDANHDDGFQSWSIDATGRVGRGVVKRVTLRGNTFISYTDPAQPFKAAMQGIGCFDGMFEDWVIENNLIVTDMWHGIALYGATNCRIVNNTIAKNPIDAAARTPWIQISPHKHGQPSTGNLVRNNLTPTLHVPPAAATVDHNVVGGDAAALFADFAKFDFHPRASSPAVGAGSDERAPRRDLDGHARGSPVAVGALEPVAVTGVLKR
jgi:parallel beta-helix repeat protein